MGLVEFLAMMVGALLVTFILMVVGEKIISLVIRENCAPFIKIIGSLVFALGILSVCMYSIDKASEVSIFMLSGSIILLNKFWFGHFSRE
ncbi:hypothetical protein MKY34_02015 [Sporosarcina sp. FSL K6-1522]|uniref:hypothetical protein n=1 Tax=Sporosarcina sp. FSL K6-1522 TaxID=2921554 RepID=UPI00315A1BE2